MSRFLWWEILLGRTYGFFSNVSNRLRATTHADLALRARQRKIPTQTIPNASILNAIGTTGLQLYNFGQTVSMVFFTENWKPDSFYDRIKENAQIGLHTLVLVDIKVKEQSYENMAKGRKIYEPPRYMTVAQCASQMLEIEEQRKEGVCAGDRLAIGAARVASSEQRMVCGTLKEMAGADLGPPLHSLVLLGNRTHELERDFIKDFAIDVATFDRSWAKYHKRQQ
jgi:diphthine methyl ester synthase